jgi:hypothetical protein
MRCGVVKPNTPEHFGPDARRLSGLHASCRDCANRARHTTAYRQYSRATRKRRPSAQRWLDLPKEQRVAYDRVHYAIKTGRLVRQPCRWCGEARTHAHHHKGYSPPHALDVDWLCSRCHVAEHHGWDGEFVAEMLERREANGLPAPAALPAAA